MLHEQSSALHWGILIGTQSLVLCIKKNLLNILLSAILLYYHFTATLLEKVVCSLPLLHHLPFSHLISSQQTFCSTIDRDCTLRSPMICMFSHLTVIFLFSSLQTCQQHGIILSSWKATLFLALRYFTLLFFPLSLLAIFFFFLTILCQTSVLKSLKVWSWDSFSSLLTLCQQVILSSSVALKNIHIFGYSELYFPSLQLYSKLTFRSN